MDQVVLQYSVSELVYYIFDGYGTKLCYYQLTFTHILHIFFHPSTYIYRNTAPTNEAFADLEGAIPGITALLLEEPGLDTLRKVLLYHVAIPDVESKDLSDGQLIPTLDGGNTVEVTINADGIFINQAEVTGPDNLANNGVAHIIDAVLIPPDFVPPEPAGEDV